MLSKPTTSSFRVFFRSVPFRSVAVLFFSFFSPFRFFPFPVFRELQITCLARVAPGARPAAYTHSARYYANNWSTTMVFSDYAKLRIVFFHGEGHGPSKIVQLLAREGISASKTGIEKFLERYRQTGSTARQRGSGGKWKITGEIKKLVEEQMRRDDETTASQLHALLTREGHRLSLSTVLRCRSQLGWTYRGSAYCQVIRDANKVKRLDWARANIGGDFSDVVYTDECSIQMESHRRFSCHKHWPYGELPKNKLRLVVNTGILVPQVQVDVEKRVQLVRTHVCICASLNTRTLSVYIHG